MSLLISLLAYLLLCALLAVPVMLAARAVRAPFAGLTFCMVAVAVSLLIVWGLSSILPLPKVYLPLGLAAAVLVLSLSLGTTLWRALGVLALQAPFYLLLSVLWQAAGLAPLQLDLLTQWFTP